MNLRIYPGRLADGKHCLRKRSQPRLSHRRQQILQFFPFLRLFCEKADQLFPFLYLLLRKERSAHHIIQNVFSRRGNGLVYQHKNPIHVKVIPGNIINTEPLALFPAEIKGNTLNIPCFIFPFRNLSVYTADFPHYSFFALMFCTDDDHCRCQSKTCRT